MSLRSRLPLAAAFVLAGASSAAALDLPTRRAGLWDLKMTSDARNRQPLSMQQCTDAETDRILMQTGGSVGRDMCSKYEVRQVGATYVVDTVCQVGAMNMTSQAVISGDFNSAYTVKLTSKHSGQAVPGMPANGVTNTTFEANWIGACKTGQKPGDIITPGGHTVNVRDMQRFHSR